MDHDEIQTCTLTPPTPNYTVKFHFEDRCVGEFDFNGPVMVFKGDADEAAKVFVEWVSQHFAERLKQERERCIDILMRLQERAGDAHNYYAYAINVIKGEI